MKIKSLKFTEREKNYLDKYQSVFCDNYKNITALNARIDILNLDYKDLQVSNLTDRINSMIKESFIFDKLNILDYSIKEDYEKALLDYNHFYYPRVSFKFPKESNFKDLKYKGDFLYSSGDDGLIRIFRYDKKIDKIQFLKEIGILGSICSAYEIYKNYLLYAVNKNMYVYDFKSEKKLQIIEIDEKIDDINFDLASNILSIYFGNKEQDFDILDGNVFFKSNIKNTKKILSLTTNALINNHNKILCNKKLFSLKIINRAEFIFDRILSYNNKNIIVCSNNEKSFIFKNENNTLKIIGELDEIPYRLSINNKYLLTNNGSNPFLIKLYEYKNNIEKFDLIALSSINNIKNAVFSKDEKFLFFMIEGSYYLERLSEIKANKIIFSSKNKEILKSNSPFCSIFFSEKNKYLIIQVDTTFINNYRKVFIFDIINKKILKEFEFNCSSLSYEFFDNENKLVFLQFLGKNLKLEIYSSINWTLLNTSEIIINNYINPQIYKINEECFFIPYDKKISFFYTKTLREEKHFLFTEKILLFLQNSQKILCASLNKLYIFSFDNIDFFDDPLIIETNHTIKYFELYDNNKKLIIFYNDYYEIYDIENYKIISKNPCRELLGYLKFDNYISIIYKNEIKTFKHTNDGAELIYTLNSITSGGDYKKIPENMFAFDDGFIIKKLDGKVYGSKNWKDYVYFVDGDEIKDYPQWESYFEAVWNSNIFEEL